MDHNLNFFSVSSDGRIVSWTLVKVRISQKGHAGVKMGSGGSQMAGGLQPCLSSPTGAPPPPCVTAERAGSH